MDQVVIAPLADPADEPVEVVERKGLGHPDTICDALAEAVSRALCREYLDRFGAILHHNVDKALLSAGRSAPCFGGGEIISPMSFFIGGRAVLSVGSDAVRIDELVTETSRGWLRSSLHAVDPDQVKVHSLIHPGSQELRSLFTRGSPAAVPLANDTSFGVGHAPLSPVERLVLRLEQEINGRDRSRVQPAWGEDVKVMAVRHGQKLQLTIACAMIDRYLGHVDDYLAEKRTLAKLATKTAADHGFCDCEVAVNAADDPAAHQVYLTVTGTSAEAGDDGQVGRGNRVTGLITPCRPMSLEAAAGKNPVSHVGKIYNVIAQAMAEAIVCALPQVKHAQCHIVSRIGAPVTSPALVSVRIAMLRGEPLSSVEPTITAIAQDRLARIPQLGRDFLSGSIALF